MSSRRTAVTVLIGMAAAGFAGLPGCSSHPEPWEKLSGPPRVVVSVPALYSFVKQVGGDRVGVICLCTQTGPHHYEYNPNDAVALKKADRLLGIGLGLDEKFLDKLVSNSGSIDPKKYVKLGDSKSLREDYKILEGGKDPHLWLGIHTAKKLVLAIADELKAADPPHAAEYTKNADDYCKKLDALRSEYRGKLKGWVDEKILPMHDALQYFGDKQSFHLNIQEAIELTPGEMPTSERYKKLLDLCTDADEKDVNARKPIRFIATEPQYEEKAAEVLKSELKKKGIDAVLIEIDPLETADPKELNADWYETKMRENLDRLVTKLADNKKK